MNLFLKIKKQKKNIIKKKLKYKLKYLIKI